MTTFPSVSAGPLAAQNPRKADLSPQKRVSRPGGLLSKTHRILDLKILAALMRGQGRLLWDTTALIALLFLFQPAAYSAEGLASWYSSADTCRYNPIKSCPMANGRSIYDLERKGAFFAVSYRFRIGESLRVCNTANGRCVEVEILDRGPSRRLKRVIDLSKKAFSQIADPKQGIIKVRIERIDP